MRESDASGKLSSTDHFDTEEAFLAAYKAQDYPKPSVTVDLVIFTVETTDLKVLLIQRGGHPFKGAWALPGGFVLVGDGVKDQGEDLEEAAHRELEEETGLPKGSCYLQQFATFGEAYRDPRTRVISVAFFALVRSNLMELVVAGDDAAAASWWSLSELGSVPLAFDHADILAAAVAHLRAQIDVSPLAFSLVPAMFTAAELREVFEAVKGVPYEATSFHRRMRRLIADGIIKEARGKRRGSGRPSTVYQFAARETKP